MNPEENGRLIHDVATTATHEILRRFNLRPEEYRDAYEMVHVDVTTALRTYIELRHRELHRLAKRAKPSEN